MNDAIKAPIVLTLICSAVCGLLALGNHLTKDKITAAESQAIQDSLANAFGEAEYTTLDLQFDGVNQLFSNPDGTTIFDITTSGYEKNSQHLLIGINENCEVSAISFVSISDSPTQSKKVQETAFLSQFIGQSEANETYDAIAGATKSSDGVHTAVTRALDIYCNHKEEILHGKDN